MKLKAESRYCGHESEIQKTITECVDLANAMRGRIKRRISNSEKIDAWDFITYRTRTPVEVERRIGEFLRRLGNASQESLTA